IFEEMFAPAAPSYEIRQADFNKWAYDYYGEPFDVIPVDFPWGIGQDEFNQSSRTAERYVDTPETFEELLGALETNLYRLLAKNGVLVFWFYVGDYQKVRDRLEKMGLDVNPVPFTWCKTTAGIIPRAKPPFDLRQCTEVAFICRRGDARVLGKRNWFEGDPPKSGDRFS